MHNIPDMIKGLNIGEIGQFSHDPQPRKGWFFTHTPRHMYDSIPLGATVPGDFMVYWACERCLHLPYDRAAFKKNCFFRSVKDSELVACSSCGYLKYKQVVGRVLYVVSQIMAKTRASGDDQTYRVWGWEYAEPISPGTQNEQPLTIVRRVL